MYDTGSLWNYYRNEANDGANGNNRAVNYRINNNKMATNRSFECKKKIIGRTLDDGNILYAEVVD